MGLQTNSELSDLIKWRFESRVRSSYEGRRIALANGGKMKPFLREFLRDVSGQTTTEYVLILAVIVTVFMQFKTKMKVIMTKLLTNLSDETEKAFEE
jgi:Flp pilus assembly pilin Flp